MAATRNSAEPAARGWALRARLLLLFLLPVLLMGAGTVILAEMLLAGGAGADGMGPANIRLIYGTLWVVGILLAAGLAMIAAERVRWPIAWLLRAMDTGQIRPLGPDAATAGWEMSVLVRRVQVLLQQNLSGARAVEQLDALRDEIAALLDSVATGAPIARDWPANRAAHPLTRRLATFFQAREETTAEARDSLRKLQGLLEQDWREETRCVDEIVRRAEHCFLEHTQIAMELEQLDRSLNGVRARDDGSDGAAESQPPAAVKNGDVRPPVPAPSESDYLATVGELRLGFDRWAGEVQRLLERADALERAPSAERLPRLEAWMRWIDESLNVLQVAGGPANNHAARTLTRLKKVADLSAGASQDVHALSRETAQLQRTWTRLGERLRSYMARVEEVRNGAPPIASDVARGDEFAEDGPQ